ncbi:hypothetical protein [Bacillus sp. REN10]|uniref:hypothetical protein n=1 Tax=Bacillus sp. REN10 TaxID=2782541 RepID=UPI00193B730B|nr:hypothetical protein [Bacillus sp. REN10]
MNPKKFNSMYEIFEYYMNKVDEEPTEHVELKEGDWVESMCEKQGFIAEIHGQAVYVVVVNIKGVALKLMQFNIAELKKMDNELHSEDYNSMAHIALATGGKEWFMELTDKMKSLAQ